LCENETAYDELSIKLQNQNENNAKTAYEIAVLCHVHHHALEDENRIKLINERIATAMQFMAKKMQAQRNEVGLLREKERVQHSIARIFSARWHPLCERITDLEAGWRAEVEKTKWLLGQRRRADSVRA
jgi:hypothetical protein